MSRSPERISSYRRHFEDSSTSSYQVRVSSPSPTRRDARHASAGYSRAGAGRMCVDSVGRRTVSAARRSRVAGVGVGAGAMVCVGPSGEPAIDLEVAAAENQEFLSTRTTERQEMIVLNDRLAVYIDKVRSLEQQNKLLEAEIEAYQNRFEKPTGLRLIYEEQLKELRKIAEQMRVQRDLSLAAKESTAAQLEAIKLKYEEAVELRKKAELDIETFRPDVDKATSSRIVLEKKLEQLEVEIEFLKRIHQQEIDELMKQIYAAHVSAQSAFTLPDLASAMKQIQTQYDDIAAKNLQEMDSWYKNKFEDLTQKTSKHVDKVRGFRDAIAGAKKDIQSKERDMDSLRTRNEALEAQIREMQEKYKKELEDLQARIEALQLELKTTKEKIALHLREYQDLLNIKMALEIEITTYRKLIEGEDLRLSGMMQTLSLTSCSTSAIGAGVSLSGGSTDGVGGMGSGLGGSGGGVGGMRGGLGMGGDMAAGGMAAGAGTGGLGDRIGAEGTGDWKGTAGRAGGVGVGASAGAAGTGGVSGAAGAGGRNGAGVGGLASGGVAPGTGVGAGGLGTGPGGFGTGPGGVGSGPGGVGSGPGGVGTGPGGVGTVPGGVGTGPGGVGTGPGGVGTGPGGLGSGLGGLGSGPGGVGTGPGGVGTGPGGLGSGPGGVGTGAGSLGTGAGGMGNLGISAGGTGDSSVSGIGVGAGGDTTGLGSMGGAGSGFGRGDGGVGEGKGYGVGGGIGGDGKAHGLGPAGTGGGIRGSAGCEGVGGDDVALSGPGGMGKTDGGRGDMGGARIGFGSDGYDGNIEAYAEQAVELTERRTVLIRTVKNEDDVVEMDHQEQTYTISGAADDSDVD